MTFKERPEARLARTPAKCAFCRSDSVFDHFRDMVLCDNCGAHYTSNGWEHPAFALCDTCFSTLINGAKGMSIGLLRLLWARLDRN